MRGDTENVARWQQAAKEMHDDICAHGVDKRGVFCQHYDTTALDASVLLIPLLGFPPPDDERVRARVLAIADELTVDDLVLRYRVEETDDGHHASDPGRRAAPNEVNRPAGGPFSGSGARCRGRE